MAKAKIAAKRKIEEELRSYELVLMLSAELRETEVKKKLKEITEMITKAGGKVTHEDFWGKRSLAYKIKKHTEAVYMLYNLELPNTFIRELKDHFRIEKDIIRSMLVTLPDDYVYTKFDLDAEPEKPQKPGRKAPTKKNVSIKHSSSEAPKKEAKDKGKEADEKELDKKLDQIVEGDDLNL